MVINFQELFCVTPASISSVMLVRTPLEYPGTNDSVVIRVRKTAEGWVMDDGGDAEWFVTTAGGNWRSTAVKNVMALCRLAFGVERQKEGKLVIRQMDEADIGRAVMQVAQTAISVFSAAMVRQAWKDSDK